MTESSESPSPVLPRSANLLGALALQVTDQILGAATEATGRPASDTMALVALHSALAGGSQDALATLLNLTQSGSTRLVDRLVRQGLVERRPGRDKRTVALTLTPAGQAASRQAQAARSSALHGLLAQLDATEQRHLTGLLERLLTTSVGDRAQSLRTCRLCDLSTCHDIDACPVTAAGVAARSGLDPVEELRQDG